MKAALLVLVISLLLSACSDASGQAPGHYLDKAGDILLESHGNPELIGSALEVYSEGLEQHPKDPDLLSRRASLYVNLGKYEEALGDMDALYASGQIHNEGLLFRCMLRERLAGELDADTLDCYEEAMNAFSTTSTAQGYPSANHVMAALLAESHNSEELLQTWLASDDPMKVPMLEELLMDFDRKDYLHQVLP